MKEEQTLVIHKFEALFNILHEVKSVLNFKIKQINTGKFDQNFKRLSEFCTKKETFIKRRKKIKVFKTLDFQ